MCWKGGTRMLQKRWESVWQTSKEKVHSSQPINQSALQAAFGSLPSLSMCFGFCPWTTVHGIPRSTTVLRVVFFGQRSRGYPGARRSAAEAGSDFSGNPRTSKTAFEVVWRTIRISSDVVVPTIGNAFKDTLDVRASFLATWWVRRLRFQRPVGRAGRISGNVMHAQAELSKTRRTYGPHFRQRNEYAGSIFKDTLDARGMRLFTWRNEYSGQVAYVSVQHASRNSEVTCGCVVRVLISGAAFQQRHSVMV